MSTGFFADRPGFFRRLHPVTRILLLFLAFTCALVAQRPLYLLPLWAMFLLAGWRAGAMPGLRRVWWLLLLVGLASFGIWTFAFGGTESIFSLGPFSATRPGLIFGAGMGLRLGLMIFTGLIFLACTPVEEFSQGLTSLGLPFAVSFALSLSFRLAPLFGDTVRSILDAQRARGLKTNRGLSRLKTYVPLLAPVFAGALRRADLLAIALESKGFGRPGRRGSLYEWRVGFRDGLALALLFAVLAGLITLRFWGYGGVSR